VKLKLLLLLLSSQFDHFFTYSGTARKRTCYSHSSGGGGRINGLRVVRRNITVLGVVIVAITTKHRYDINIQLQSIYLREKVGCLQAENRSKHWLL
jgi:hypothetical protein